MYFLIDLAVLIKEDSFAAVQIIVLKSFTILPILDGYIL